MNVNNSSLHYRSACGLPTITEVSVINKCMKNVSMSEVNVKHVNPGNHCNHHSIIKSHQNQLHQNSHLNYQWHNGMTKHYQKYANPVNLDNQQANNTTERNSLFPLSPISFVCSSVTSVKSDSKSDSKITNESSLRSSFSLFGCIFNECKLRFHTEQLRERHVQSHINGVINHVSPSSDNESTSASLSSPIKEDNDLLNSCPAISNSDSGSSSFGCSSIAVDIDQTSTSKQDHSTNIAQKPFVCILDGCKLRFCTERLRELHVRSHISASSPKNGNKNNPTSTKIYSQFEVKIKTEKLYLNDLLSTNEEKIKSEKIDLDDSVHSTKKNSDNEDFIRNIKILHAELLPFIEKLRKQSNLSTAHIPNLSTNATASSLTNHRNISTKTREKIILKKSKNNQKANVNRFDFMKAVLDQEMEKRKFMCASHI